MLFEDVVQRTEERTGYLKRSLAATNAGPALKDKASLDGRKESRCPSFLADSLIEARHQDLTSLGKPARDKDVRWVMLDYQWRLPRPSNVKATGPKPCF